MKVVVAVLIHNNKFLIARRTGKYSGYYEFPGGKVEINESLEDAISREIYEELNLKLDNFQFLFSMDNIIDNHTYNIHVFTHKINNFNIMSNVHDKLIWVDHTELNNYLVFNNVIEIIEYMKKSDIL